MNVRSKPVFFAIIAAALCASILALGDAGFRIGYYPPLPDEPLSIIEAESFAASGHPVFWLNSGGEAFEEGGTIRTASGDLPEGEVWRELYARSNPEDTDGGLHPQNLFRLLTKKTYGNHAVEMTAVLRRIIASESPNRNESNGVLLMFRYADADNLYYAGLRVDGNAVIKKKIGGVYHTLASVPVFAYTQYDKEAMPNLIPLNVPIGLRAEVQNLDGGRALISLFIDIGNSGTWHPILRVVDGAASGEPPALTEPGHAGIRSDFMEAEFLDFRIEEFMN